MCKQRAILCDIDMTVLDTSEIMKICELTADSSDWQCFYDYLENQKEMTWCVDILKRMNMPIIFLTGRNERCRAKTVSALDKFGLDYILVMRDENDFSSDSEMKENRLKELVNDYDFVFAIDDKDANCVVFHKYGIPTLQVYYPENERVK